MIIKGKRGVVRPTLWALFAAALLMGSAVAAEAQTTVILVRHAEKADAPANDPPLTDAGRKRAERLAEYLHDAKISVVYTTPYARTRETAAPLVDAGKLKLVETAYAGGADVFAKQVADRIRKDNVGQTVLVVGHSNTTPAVVKALTGVEVPAIPDTEYSNLFVVTISADGKTTSLVRAKY